MPATLVKIPRNTRRSKLNKTLSCLLGEKDQPRLAVKLEFSEAEKYHIERLKRAGETVPPFRIKSSLA